MAGRLADGLTERNWPGSIVLDGQDSAREKVMDVAQTKGYDFIKVYSSLSASQPEAIAKEAQEVGLTFAGYLPVVVPLKHAINLGQKSIEHLEGFHIALSTKSDSLIAEIKKARESEGIRASVNAFWQGEALGYSSTRFNQSKGDYVPPKAKRSVPLHIFYLYVQPAN